MTAPLHIVYRAYGDRAYLDQTLYSILSLRHQTPAGTLMPQVVIYTDQPAYFQACGLDVSTRTLTREQVGQWSGRYGFVHRLKLELLRDALAAYGAPLLYVDGDTIWIEPPDRLQQALAAGQFLMHKFEGDVSPRFYPALYECLRREEPRLQRELNLKLGATVPMWNSGVVGLPAAVVDLLDRSLQLCDALFLRCYQREWLEQLALSIAFQGQPVDTAEREIAHYWGYADEATPLVRDLLRQSSAAASGFVAVEPADLETRSRAVQRTTVNRRRQALKRLRRSYHKRLQHLRVAIDLRLGRV